MSVLGFGRQLVPTHKEKNQESENVFRAIQSNDLAQAVLSHQKTAEFYEMLLNLGANEEGHKCKETSQRYRECGNISYRAKQFQEALIFYNKALLFAPNNSIEIKFAYSNRSLVFLENELASACLSDIETILSLGCPADLKAKLLKRKKQALQHIHKEQLLKMIKSNSFAHKFFKLNVKCNPDIPCATADLEVVLKDNIPRVVAKKDIKAGTVLAVETAFVNAPHIGSHLHCCNYCNKISLNLIPCSGCCWVLFCSENCRDKCLQEYHSIECIIQHEISCCSEEPNINLALKATLKIKNIFKTWQDFIDASLILGEDRISRSSVNEIFTQQPSSLLSFSEKNHHLVYGKMYSVGSRCAFIIKKLEEKVPSFFPREAKDKDAAIKSFARVLLYLAVYGTTVPLVLSAANVEEANTSIHRYNCGLFPFCSKLKMSCNANTLTVSLNKELALVAVQPIVAGAELTIPFMENWILPDGADAKQKFIYQLYDTVCDCKSCVRKDHSSFLWRLNDLQSATLKKLNPKKLNDNFDSNNAKEIFERVCAKMHIFSDLPYTECNSVYALFRKCILHMQDMITGNIILGD